MQDVLRMRAAAGYVTAQDHLPAPFVLSGLGRGCLGVAENVRASLAPALKPDNPKPVEAEPHARLRREHCSH